MPALRELLGACRTALLCTVLFPATLVAQSLQIITDDGTPLRLTNHREGLHLERPGDPLQALPLAVGSVANDLRHAPSQSGADRFWIAAVEPTEAGPRIAVLVGQGDEVERLPELPQPTARLLREPTLLHDAQGLRAVLWLAGDTPTSQVLHTARFEGEAWKEVSVVAPQGPGSQMALTATVLEDGSWLAAWAAFDGQDTEILWSRAVDGQWSKPSPVTRGNRVPDITPHLLTLRSGALLAWSRYDGNDYRVVVARFEQGAWQPSQILGGAGTLYPSFQPGETPTLVFQHAVPTAWEVVALSPEGRLQHRGKLEIDRDEPPLVEHLDADGAMLAWPNGRARAAEQKRLRWIK